MLQNKRRIFWLAYLLFLCLVAVYVLPSLHTRIIGACRGESKYQGRYTNDWREDLQAGELVEELSYACSRGCCQIWSRIYWKKTSPLWKEWLGKAGLQFSTDSSLPAVLNGDSESVSVLLELLEDEDPRVRRAAIHGLYNAGRHAEPAVPKLMKLVFDRDQKTSDLAKRALERIRQETGHPRRISEESEGP